MKRTSLTLTLLSAIVLLSACSNDKGAKHPPGLCQQLQTVISSPQQHRLNSSGLNEANRAAMTQQYKSLGCHD